MKKILFTLLSLVQILTSSQNYELKLFEKVIPLVLNKEKIKVYYTQRYAHIFSQKSAVFIQVENCEDADFIFVKDCEVLPKKCERKPYFLTTFEAFKKSHSAIGVFYWKKGRPQLLFKKENIEKYHLEFPRILEKYAY